MNLASIIMARPMTMKATATSHTRIRGSMMAATPRRMSTIAGTIIVKPDSGFSIIPLQVSAIGHIGIGTDSDISSSLSFDDCNTHGIPGVLASAVPRLFIRFNLKPGQKFIEPTEQIYNRHEFDNAFVI
jgi:hypothetical protein